MNNVNALNKKIIVESYTRETLYLLENAWRNLENGSEMTYFQSFNWFCSIINFAPRDSWFYEASFVVAKSYMGEVLMIAPMWVIKHRYRFVRSAKITFLSTSWTDYNNFVYKNFNSDVLDAILNFIHDKYKISKIWLSLLPENSSSYKYIVSRYNITSDTKGTCVKVDFDECNNTYDHLLSKHAKQNIRTAINRMKKDGLDFVVCEDDICIGRDVLYRIWNERYALKNGKTSCFSMRYITGLYDKFTSVRWKKFNPIIHDDSCKIITIKTGEVLMAYFLYGELLNPHRIFILSAGVDKNFQRYSPGIVAAYKIFLRLSENGCKFVDLTRGTEFYKFELGGKKHFIHNIKFFYEYF